MATKVKSNADAASLAEDHTRSEISELFLLLKSGKLSPEEQHQLKMRLDDLIQVTERKHKQHCCGK